MLGTKLQNQISVVILPITNVAPKAMNNFCIKFSTKLCITIIKYESLWFVSAINLNFNIVVEVKTIYMI